MKDHRVDRSGVSEIVGALMLILIVVIAATTLAVFISEQQKSAQAQQILDQKREQENIEVLSITPVSNDGYKWSSFNITLVSLHYEESRITRMVLNDHVVEEFDLWRVNPYTLKMEKEPFTSADLLVLKPLEQVIIGVDLLSPTAMHDPAPFGLNNFVKMDIFTAWLNDFSKSFVPPSAVPTHSPGSGWNASSADYDHFLILNGQSSVAHNGAYIVSWSWTVESESLADPDDFRLFSSSGSVSRFDLPLTDAANRVELTVTDNFGMVGRSSYTFYS